MILPTETVYGVGATARGGIGLLREKMNLAGGGGAGGGGVASDAPRVTWHAASEEAVIAGLRISHPMHLRIVRRLAPGPVRFLRSLTAVEADEVRRELGVAAGVIDEGNEFSVRVPDHALTLDVLRRVGEPVVIERLSSLGLGDGSRLLPADTELAGRMSIAPIIDDGPTKYGSPSTTVRLLDRGRYEVVALPNSGVYDARRIRREVERTILFVCTGNTCRSPMAEAVARNLLEKNPSSIITHVDSAGVAATNGQPMTPEAQRALTDLGLIDPRSNTNAHRSQDLTRDMIERAEIIFAMTRSHAQTVEQISPLARGKVVVLDPQGRDVEDPIGGPLDVYRSTAKALQRMIVRRLEQLENGELPASGRTSS